MQKIISHNLQLKKSAFTVLMQAVSQSGRRQQQSCGNNKKFQLHDFHVFNEQIKMFWLVDVSHAFKFFFYLYMVA